MRIGLLPGPQVGEGERGPVARAEARELRLLGHDVEVLDVGEPSASFERRLEACELLHLHRDGTDRGPGEGLLSVAALAARKPVVVTLHERPDPSERVHLAAASALVSPSRGSARAAERALGLAPGRVHVVPHGLCRELPPRTAPAPVPRSGAPLIVAHFGPLGVEDGTLDLVCSLSLLPHGAVELRLGGRADDPDLEARIRSGRGGSVLRRIEEDDSAALGELLDGAHVCAFPARGTEHYGLAVDEALALGLPVWVSAGGAPAERLVTWGTPGRVLPARSPLVWAEAFCSALVSPYLLADQRARVPSDLPDAGDAVRMLEQVMTSAAGRSAA